MNITECFQMRKRRIETPKRANESGFPPRTPVNRLQRIPHGFPAASSFNNSFSDQSLEIVWDNNSPSPGRTLSLGKRKKHYGSDSSSSGGEISDLVQKLADKSGHTPEANPPLLAFWMSRDNTATLPKSSDDTAVQKENVTKEKSTKDFQTPSRRPRRVVRRCNKSKMKLLKQDIELLIHPVENTAQDLISRHHTGLKEKLSVSEKGTIQESSDKQQIVNQEADVLNHPEIKAKCSSGNPANSCLSIGGVDFFDVWDTDEDDILLSQMKIPSFNKKIPETQIMTNTQFLDSGKDTQKTMLNENHSPSHVSSNDSIVTESWDFIDTFDDSDDENFLQSALEDFEKSQQVSIPNVRRLSNLHVKPSLVHKDTCKIGDFNEPRQTAPNAKGSKENLSAFQKNLVTDQNCSQKRTFTFIPRSSIQGSVSAKSEQLINSSNSLTSSNDNFKSVNAEQDSHKINEKNLAEGNASRQKDSHGQMNIQSGAVTTKPTRYSKEEIEKKKREAQNRRRQKLALSQQKHHR